MRTALALVAASLGLVASAGGALHAQSAAPPSPESAPEASDVPEAVPPVALSHDDFGPAITLEAIVVVGNDHTRTHLIRDVLPFQPGDVLTAGDPRLRRARFRVLGLGFFRNVVLTLQRGSQRGHVILTIAVEERGTIVLNRLWFGAGTIAPWWVGADLTERNLAGTGISAGGGLVYASGGDVGDSRAQYAGELRLGVPAIGGSRWGAFGQLTGVRGSEAYRARGDGQDTDSDAFRAFSYRRLQARAGAGYRLSSLSRVTTSVRAELLDAEVPIAPTRSLDDGRLVAVDLHLQPGRSHVVSGALTYDRDTRADPILSTNGTRITLEAELGSGVLGSSYDFAALGARFEAWWPLAEERHAFGVRLGAKVIAGDAPLFERVHAAEVNRMLAPRALGLLVSASAPLDVLSTSPGKPIYGDAGATAAVEYVYRLFGGGDRRGIYGGDLFVSTGLWGLAETDSLRVRDTSTWDALPIDVFVDAGLRIDTDIGVFELSVANALGRLPR